MYSVIVQITGIADINTDANNEKLNRQFVQPATISYTFSSKVKSILKRLFYVNINEDVT
jgi:hypothetical protein